MSKIKTINLTGGETAVEFDRPFTYIECNNLSNSDVLMSTKSNFESGDDNVLIISPDSAATIGDLGTPKIKTVYLSGSGKVQIVAKGYPESSFKTKGKGGDSGGGGGGSGISTYAELPDKPAINGITLLDGDTSFEQLGWHELTKEDIKNIVDEAFDTYITDNLIKIYKNCVRESIVETDLYMALNMTIECCFMISSIPNKYGRIYDVGSDLSGFVMDIALNGRYADLSLDGSKTWYTDKEYSVNIDDIQFDNVYTVSVAFDQENVSLYKNGVKTAELPLLPEFKGHTEAISPVRINMGRTSERTIDGIVYSLRIYDRKLSDEEITYNFNIDALEHYIGGINDG